MKYIFILVLILSVISAKRIDYALQAEVFSSASYKGLDINHLPIESAEKNPEWPGTCWASSNNQRAYYNIQFEPTIIEEIVITNRADCCGMRLQEFEVLIDNEVCFSQSEPAVSGEILSIKGKCQDRMGSSVTVRFASRRKSEEAYLQICGLEVWGKENPDISTYNPRKDVALSATIQSSESWESEKNQKKPLSRGNKDPFWPGTCWASQNDPQAFYQVDFKQPAYVDEIIITNRQDCCAERMQGFKVSVDSHVCFRRVEPLKPGEALSIKECQKHGSTVIISFLEERQHEDSILQICGIQIFAFDEDPVQNKGEGEFTDLAIGGDVTCTDTFQGKDISESPIKKQPKNPNWPGTCYQSQEDREAFWTVNFEFSKIEQILIRNRQDLGDRLQSFEVLVDDKIIFKQEEPAKAGEEIVIDANTKGSSVTIRYSQNRSNWEPFLSFCGVRVMGKEFIQQLQDQWREYETASDFEGECHVVIKEQPEFL